MGLRDDDSDASIASNEKDAEKEAATTEVKAV